MWEVGREGEVGVEGGCGRWVWEVSVGGGTSREVGVGGGTSREVGGHGGRGG